MTKESKDAFALANAFAEAEPQAAGGSPSDPFEVSNGPMQLLNRQVLRRIFEERNLILEKQMRPLVTTEITEVVGGKGSSSSGKGSTGSGSGGAGDGGSSAVARNAAIAIATCGKGQVSEVSETGFKCK